MLLDIKSGLPDLYQRVTGRPLQPTLDFARRLSGLGKKMWIRFVLVPGLTDGVENVDAIADFADVDFTALAGRHDNVLVLRSLSKSYSLAGMRVGIALGHPDLIAALELVKDSYNVSVASQAVAVAALGRNNFV